MRELYGLSEAYMLENFGEEQQDTKIGAITINTFEQDFQLACVINVITADTLSCSKLLNSSNYASTTAPKVPFKIFPNKRKKARANGIHTAIIALAQRTAE